MASLVDSRPVHAPATPRERPAELLIAILRIIARIVTAIRTAPGPSNRVRPTSEAPAATLASISWIRHAR